MIRGLKTKLSAIALATALAPLVVLPQAQPQHGVSLSWVQSPSTGVAGQNVYRSLTTGGPYIKIASVAAVANAYLDPVVDGKTYFYVVTAVSQGPVALESVFSNQVSITAPGPAPGPPTGLAASDQ